jgi:osmotically inducible lipoprotein OsmB
VGKIVLSLIIGLSLLSAGGCTRTQNYMATGAGLGAAGGTLVAATTGGALVGGALVGGALGTGAGYIMSR